MKIRNLIAASTVVVAILFVASCSKENNTVSTPQFKTGTSITSQDLSGAVKGTMLSGKTYYFSSPITVNSGDTLVMQSGVKLLAKSPSAMLIVNGVFISLGTKNAPNWITGEQADLDPSTYKQTTYLDPNADNGLKLDGKMWGGIQCSKTCTLLDIKWTHLDFAGGTVDQGSDLTNGFYAAGDALFVTLFQNPQGIYILEDSWIYGSTTDACRIKGGSVHIMRNTVEKLAYNDGDAFNVKGGTIGDMAYNLIIGTAKGGTKASNKGQATGAPQTNINMYNNTYLNGGWRSLDPDRGANVDYEEGAKGKAFNNIIVNCKTGLRFLENPAADTTNSDYGNNLSYGDSVKVTNQFMATTHAGKLNTTDIPSPATYYTAYKGTHWFIIAAYDGTSLVSQNNPKFVNYPLPIAGQALRNITWAGGFDFHLASGSPAIGKGNSTFSPLNSTASLTNKYLAASVTPPNKDLGAYPTDGTGNQH